MTPRPTEEGPSARPSRSVSPAREAAARALRRVRVSGARLDDSLAGLPELDGLEARDRGLANELVIGTVKRRASLDAVLGSFTKAPLRDADPDVRDILRVAAFQLLFLDRVPAYAVVDEAVALAVRKGKGAAGFTNAVLRKVAAQGRARLESLGEGDSDRAWGVRLSYPPWLIKRVRLDLGDEAASVLLTAADLAPERCLRVNAPAGDLQAARESLNAAGFTTVGVDGLPQALLYEGPPLESSAPFLEGLVTPQSRGSQIAGVVAAAGARVPGPAFVDLCAAPGGKTSQLAALLPGAAITAVEADGARAEVLRRNLRRLRVSDVDVVVHDALALPRAYDGGFDAALLDAPCSGLGTLASRPDLRWRRRAADIGRLAELQSRLLAKAAVTVRPGGALTYAVCTVTRAETLDVVEGLLRSGGWSADDLSVEWPGLVHPEAGGSLLVVPPRDGSTAFFIARLRRDEDRSPQVALR